MGRCPICILRCRYVYPLRVTNWISRALCRAIGMLQHCEGQTRSIGVKSGTAADELIGKVGFTLAHRLPNDAHGQLIEDTLLYGRLHLPRSALEALYLRRTSPTGLVRLTAVSDSTLPSGGALLATIQNDYAKYSTEYLFSSDSALIGVRGLYNFGHDPRLGSRWPAEATSPIAAVDAEPQPAQDSEPHSDAQHGRLSAGAEAYFSPVNKSGGMSTAVRFTTLPTHNGFPYTMTLTLNPLMGNISSAWASQAGEHLGLCSRFVFNFYSYESHVQVGMQLWRQGPDAAGHGRRDTQHAGEVQDVQRLTGSGRGVYDSVVKVKASQDWKIGVLWEGRVQGLLASIGADLDLKRNERILGTVGIELSYSS